MSEVPARARFKHSRGSRLRQTESVTSTFPLARSGKPGYDVGEVDAFLERARLAFSDESVDEAPLKSDDIRHTAFRVVRSRGYSVRRVDAALERLEEAFATREHDAALERHGSSVFDADARAAAQEIIDRLARPAGVKFRRVSFATRGYHPADVDLFSTRIAAYVQTGQQLPVETVRSIAFRPRFRGYDEVQVDAVLDAVIRIMLAVR